MNIHFTLYLCVKGIISDLTNFFVVAFSDKADWSKPMPYIFIRSSGVVCECLSLDLKVLCNCIFISVIRPGNNRSENVLPLHFPVSSRSKVGFVSPCL